MATEERKIALDFRSLPEGLRQCGTCREVKSKDDFHKDKRRASGVRSSCKDCVNAKTRAKASDPDSEYSKKRILYRETNRETIRESQRKWKHNNKDKAALYEATRRARKAGLPDTLTPKRASDIVSLFMDSCAICGGEFEHLDHFIPIATGHGGTTEENMVPMCSRCNQSKGAKNPFVWAQTLGDEERERFYRLVEYLTRINGIATVEDYEAHVTNCFK